MQIYARPEFHFSETSYRLNLWSLSNVDEALHSLQLTALSVALRSDQCDAVTVLVAVILIQNDGESIYLLYLRVMDLGPGYGITYAHIFSISYNCDF